MRQQMTADSQIVSTAEPPRRRRGLRLPRNRRGMALLMVMIGLIVCSILTAGFLSTQGTSIGIARNERDASKCRGLAQSGIDMCYWLIRNRSDWREAMTPGTWLNNVPIGDGTVTVSVTDGAGNASFSADPTQAAVVSATGTYDGRTSTLTATIRPTGGGTVYANGNFISGNIQLGSDLLTAATIDSYNSSVGSYGGANVGSNGSFTSDSTAVGALIIYFPSIFKGTYTAAPTSLLTNVLSLLGLANAPTAMGNATEFRTPGNVVMPNTSNIPYIGSLSYTNGGAQNLSNPGRYDQISITNTQITITKSGVYYVTGNLNCANTGSSSISVQDGKSVVLIVDGNVTLNKNCTLGATGQLALYCNGSVTISGNVNTAGSTKNFILYGSPSCNSIQITGTNTVQGAIFAPQAAVTMQTGSPKFYGAVVAHDLTMKNGSALHFDQALQSLYISNVTGGSASPGTADYRITIAGGPGIGR